MLRGDLGDQVAVDPVEHQALEVGVVEDVVELTGDVAVVHVDRDGAHLEDREQGDHVLDAVLGVEADVVARADPARGQEVRELVALGLQLGVRDRAVTHLHGRLVGSRVDGMFEEVGDVQGHTPETRTRSSFSLAWPHDDRR